MSLIERINTFDNIWTTWVDKLNWNFETLNLEKLENIESYEEVWTALNSDYLLIKQWETIYKIRKDELIWDDWNTQQIILENITVDPTLAEWIPVYLNPDTWIFEKASIFTWTPIWIKRTDTSVLIFGLATFTSWTFDPWQIIFLDSEWGFSYDIVESIWVKIWKAITDELLLVDIDVENWKTSQNVT